jgi:hypothetical protein
VNATVTETKTSCPQCAATVQRCARWLLVVVFACVAMAMITSTWVKQHITQGCAERCACRVEAKGTK